MSDARQRLDRAIAAALAGVAAGEPPAAARAALLALADDPEAAALGPATALGLPRRLHAALLRLAKRTGDPVGRAGLQYLLVPPAAALAGLLPDSGAAGRAAVAAQARPVPRVIHQIWIGGRPVPETAAAWAAHAGRQGYGWKLWREADLAAIGLGDDPVFRARLDRGDVPGAVDAARYAILEREGGIYLDCDWFPARDDVGFHDFLPMSGLCALTEEVPRQTGRGPALLANSMIAAPARHPAIASLRGALAAAAARLPGAPAWWATGPLVFTLAARRGPVTLAAPAILAGSLPAGAPRAAAEALAAAARQGDGGLLIAWKPW
jgi:hypothetical protein